MNSLLLKAFVHPRETVQEVKGSNRYLVYFSFLIGFAEFLGFAVEHSLGGAFSKASIILLSVILAIPFGYILINIASFFIHITGKALKGKASFKEARTAVSFSQSPLIVNCIIWVFLLVYYYSSIFSKEFLVSQRAFNDPYLVFATAIQLVFGFYAFVLFLRMLSEVQGFGLWMSFWNIVLQGILMLVCLILLKILFSATGLSFHLSSILNFQNFGVFL